MKFEWWHILIALLPMLPVFWSIMDICKQNVINCNKRLIWLMIVIFMPVIGSLVYIFTGRRQLICTAENQNNRS